MQEHGRHRCAARWRQRQPRWEIRGPIPISSLRCTVNPSPVKTTVRGWSWEKMPDPGDKLVSMYQLSEYCPTWYSRVCTTFLLLKSSKPTPGLLPARVAKEDALLLCSAPVIFNFQFPQRRLGRSCHPARLSLLPATGGWGSFRPPQPPATDTNVSPVAIFHSTLSQTLPG